MAFKNRHQLRHSWSPETGGFASAFGRGGQLPRNCWLVRNESEHERVWLARNELRGGNPMPIETELKLARPQPGILEPRRKPGPAGQQLAEDPGGFANFGIVVDDGDGRMVSLCRTSIPDPIDCRPNVDLRADCSTCPSCAGFDPTGVSAFASLDIVVTGAMNTCGFFAPRGGHPYLLITVICGHQKYANIVDVKLSHKSRYGHTSVVPFWQEFARL
jgi:hypothetical protein